jgi:hypothetical protein
LLEKEKLNGANFMDWYHNLRINLRHEETEYILSKLYLRTSLLVQVLQITELMRTAAMMRST